MKVLLIDNFDSFSYMLKDYLEQANATCVVMRNNEDLLSTDLDSFDAVVISPGPETPQKAGKLLPFMQHVVHQKPLLGICLGHQALGEIFQAKLALARMPRHGKVDPIYHNNDAIFEGMTNPFLATRYHSLILNDIPQQLEVIAHTQENEIMAIRHKMLPLWGVQFHPESVQTQFGLTLLKNFLALAKQKY